MANTPGGGGGQPGLVDAGSFLALIKSALGTPYLWGGTNPFAGGADCSGLIYWAAGKLGITVPRTSEEMWSQLPHVAAADVKPGDLVFFPGSDGTAASPGHVGIVTSPGHMIDDPYTGVDVRYDDYSTQATGIGQVVGFARIRNVLYSGSAAGDSSGGSSILSDILGYVKLPATAFGDLEHGITDIAGTTEEGILGLAVPFIKIASDLDWFLHPNHWIRIFAGVGGGILVLGGAFQMFHTGGEIPVSAYGVSTSVGIPRAASLPLGILFTGIGGLLLFVAFHNLPETVGNMPEFLGYLASEIKGGQSPAAATAAA